MYAEHARRHLDKQHVALQERLTGVHLQAMLRRQAEDARAQVRIAPSQLDDLRAAERANALAVEQGTRGS